jgi:hypothetical protein
MNVLSYACDRNSFETNTGVDISYEASTPTFLAFGYTNGSHILGRVLLT